MLYDDAVKQRALEAIERYGPATTHRRIASMAGKNHRVLELGCATGYVSRLMMENGCRVTGVELDAAAAEAARVFCENVIVGDVNDPDILKSAGKGFDVVLAGDILEHIPDPFSVLKRLHGLLNDRGYILVSMPNVAFWRMRWDLLRGRFEYQDTGLLDKTHLRFFTVETFGKLAEETGYCVADMIINDAGFPCSDFLVRIPGLGRFFKGLALKLAQIFPNLFSFHSIYKLVPMDSGECS